MRTATMQQYAAFLNESRDDLRATRDATAKYAELEAIAKRDAIDEANRTAKVIGAIEVVMSAVQVAGAMAGAPAQMEHAKEGVQSLTEKAGDQVAEAQKKVTEAVTKRDAALAEIKGKVESGELRKGQGRRQANAVNKAFGETVLIDRANPFVNDLTIGDLRAQKGFADRLEANGGDLTKTLMDTEVPMPKIDPILDEKGEMVREHLMDQLREGLSLDQEVAGEVAGEHDELKGRAMAIHAKSVAELAAIARDLRELAAVGRKQ